jgi:hypothetical protein
VNIPVIIRAEGEIRNLVFNGETIIKNGMVFYVGDRMERRPGTKDDEGRLRENWIYKGTYALGFNRVTNRYEEIPA